MRQDLILEPELLPPTPLPPIAPRAVAGAAVASAVLLAMAGLWGGGAVSLGVVPHAPLAAAPHAAMLAPAARLLPPAPLADTAAGQPSVLTAPTGEGQAGDPAPGLAAIGAAR